MPLKYSFNGNTTPCFLPGLLAAGYKYLTIDDCWAISRDANTGKIVEDPALFPSGMKSVADYVHSKGLKFGIYSNAGRETCMKRPGSLYYENQDVQTYDAWGVDFLKYDTCNTGGAKYPDRYICGFGGGKGGVRSGTNV